MNKDEINKLLKDLGLSPSEILIYMSLLDGIQSVKELMRVTGEKRPTVYYSLNSLEKRGLVSKTGKDYGNKYQVSSIDNLLELINKNIRKQGEILKKAEKLKDFYSKNKKNSEILVSYFDNFESIRSAIFGSLYVKGNVIRTIVPGNNFFREVGQDFIEEYVNEKNKRNIKTKALWEDIPKKDVIEDYYDGSEVRQLPVDMHNRFETTIFIYDDKTLYISPKNENHAVLIQSKDHTSMMLALFDNVWSNSIKLS